MDKRVLLPEVRSYLSEHIHANPADFILKSHPFEINVKSLTQQLIGLQKAKTKFPDVYDNTEVLFPPKVNLEQTSSWSTATYKASIVTGKSFVDLTGGWGVDVLAFAKAGFSTTHLEKEKDLQAYSKLLFEAYALQVDSKCADGIDYAYNDLDYVDVLYLDPSRKTSASPKAIRLEDYEPDVLTHMELLLHKCDTLLIKTSPMLDLHRGIEQLKHVNAVHIVSVKNEVKEVLWVCSKKAINTTVFCVNLETEQPPLKFQWDLNLPEVVYAAPMKYIYEPNASIMKSQGFDVLTNFYQLQKLDHNAHLFTSEKLIDFPGRVFDVITVLPYKPKLIKKLYGKSARAVVTRNFKNTVKQLRDKFQFAEHEKDYLFFTSVKGQGAVVIEAEKLSS